MQTSLNTHPGINQGISSNNDVSSKDSKSYAWLIILKAYIFVAILATIFTLLYNFGLQFKGMTVIRHFLLGLIIIWPIYNMIHLLSEFLLSERKKKEVS